MTGCVLVVWLTMLFHANVYSCWHSPTPAVGAAYDGPSIDLIHRYAELLVPGLPQVNMPTAEAVFTLAHELGHHRARRPSDWWLASEARADTWARQHWSFVVRQLGGTLTTARALWRLLDPAWIRR